MFATFKTLLDFLEYFKDEKTCYDYYAKRIWENGTPICPHCGSLKVYVTKSRSYLERKKDVPEYSCAGCKKKFNVLTGSIFESSKIPLRKWFAAIYLLTGDKKGTTAVQMAKDLGITVKSAWRMNHKIRELYKETSPELLDGIVEADETFIGGENSNRHWDKKKPYSGLTPVLGIVQRGGMVRMIWIHNTEASTMQPILKQHIATTATLVTDAKPSYYGMYQHCNHIFVKKNPKNYYVTEGIYHTNTVENLWSTIQRGITGVYQAVSVRHLQRYATEFEFRRNYRNKPFAEKFDMMLKKAPAVRLRIDDLEDKTKNPLWNFKISKVDVTGQTFEELDAYYSINPFDIPLEEDDEQYD